MLINLNCACKNNQMIVGLELNKRLRARNKYACPARKQHANFVISVSFSCQNFKSQKRSWRGNPTEKN